MRNAIEHEYFTIQPRYVIHTFLIEIEYLVQITILSLAALSKYTAAELEAS